MKLTLLTFLTFLTFLPSHAQQPATATSRDTLAVIWSSGDPEVAEKVCFMYTHNAKKQKWFDEVILIVWGPSAKLLAEDEKLQERVKAMIKDGVRLEACIACARMYGVDQTLKDLGIDVKGMGVPLTTYLKKGYATVSF